MGLRTEAKKRVERSVDAVRARFTGELNQEARRHLGGGALLSPEKLTPVDVRFEWRSWRGDDASVAALELMTSWGAKIVAFSGDALDLLDTKKSYDLPHGSPSFSKLEVAPGERKQGLRCGLALGRLPDGAREPFLAHCWEHQNGGYTVRVLANAQSVVDRVLADVQAHEEKHGKAIAKRHKLRDESVNGRLRAHLGITDASKEPACARHELPAYLIPNATVLLHRFLTEHDATFLGYVTSRYEHAPDLSELLKEPIIEPNGDVKGVRSTLAAITEIMVAGEMHRTFRKGIAFCSFEEQPVAVVAYIDDRPDMLHIWVLAADLSLAERVLARFLAYERENSLLRGKLIRPQLTYREEIENAEILAHQPVSWDDVVLPPEIEARLRNDVIRYAQRADLLRAVGLEVKRGILLHGAPGTGKTLVCRLLATQLPGFTTIVVAGSNLQAPAAVFQLARKLAPALVVLEDIDLVGNERTNSSTRAALGSLLNELDGMGRQDQVLVVLTTNALHVLEPALADRPGRIDTVIAMPEPNAALRRRLLKHFAVRAHIEDDAIEAIVPKTDGASPAFLRELVKRAVLAAPERNGANGSNGADVFVDRKTALDARCTDHREQRSRDTKNHRLRQRVGTAATDGCGGRACRGGAARACPARARSVARGRGRPQCCSVKPPQQ